MKKVDTHTFCECLLSSYQVQRFDPLLLFMFEINYFRPIRPSLKIRASISLGPSASILGVKPIRSMT